MNGKVVKLYFRRGAIFALFLPLLLAGQSTALSADSQAVDERIDREQLLRDLEILAADSLAGRRTGTAGHEKAQRYLAGRFREIGLHQFGPDYFQRFAIAAPGFSTAPLTNGPAPPDTIRGANLIGYLPGREDSSNVIVLSAHYDHLGVRNGAVYYGANDNASGVAAMLAIAGYLRRHPLRHTLLFLASDAEELGLLGARAFFRELPLPRERMVLNVNLDMIAPAEDRIIYAAGTYHYPFLKPYLDEIARQTPLLLLLDHDEPVRLSGAREDWTHASDHAPFHHAGIPFVYFGVEDTAHYHQPGDMVSEIDPQRLHQAVEMILNTLQLLDEQLFRRSRPAGAQP